MSSKKDTFYLLRRSPSAMCRSCLAVTFLLLVVWSSNRVVVSLDVNPKEHPTPTTEKLGHNSGGSGDQTVQSIDVIHNSTGGNDTVFLRTDSNTVFQRFGLDTGAVKRTFYVVAALTGVVLLYFTFKGIRTMRRRRRKPRRYGLLADSKEMKQFRDEDEDDSDLGEEDATLFDARKHKATNKRGP